MKPVPTVGICFTHSGFLRQRRNCTVDISLGVGGSGGAGRGVSVLNPALLIDSCCWGLKPPDTSSPKQGSGKTLLLETA